MSFPSGLNEAQVPRGKWYYSILFEHVEIFPLEAVLTSWPEAEGLEGRGHGSCPSCREVGHCSVHIIAQSTSCAIAVIADAGVCYADHNFDPDHSAREEIETPTYHTRFHKSTSVSKRQISKVVLRQVYEI